jgi:hypothetical protein
VVLHRDLVVAAARGVGAHHLAVGQHHGDQQEDDGHREPRRQVEERRPRQGEHDQDLLRGVGHGGERVAGEDRQREPLGQQGLTDPVGADGPADDEPFR